MSVSVDQFGKALVTSGLMTKDEVQAFWTTLPAGKKPKDAETFSKVLIEHQQLTPFQAERVLNGQGNTLVLGDYELLNKIGAGGMGDVFKARHRQMDRLVAIKLLPPDVTKNDDAIARFKREVKAAARLSHPNIVTAFDSRIQDGRHYLVMEFVAGRDLSAVLRQNGPLSVAKAVDYIAQAARGLAYAHDHGVIHRDIKPANLLLDDHGVVKILDMGLARLEGLSAGPAESLTTSGQMMGTADYMAPEQSMDTRTADARSDIYSLGCTLFKLLTGENIFSEDTMVKTLMAHMQNPIPSLTDRCHATPPELDAIFQRMVAKAPGDRFQTMHEVEHALADCRATIQRLGNDATITHNAVGWTPRPSVPPSANPSVEQSEADGRGVHPTGVSIQVAKPQRGKKPPMRNVGLLVAGVLGAVILFGGVIISIFNDKGEKVGELNLPPGHTAKIEKNGKTETKDSVATAASSTKSTNPKSAALPASTGTAPPLAKAPFDAAQAKAHQAAWAKHLNVEAVQPNSLEMQMVLIPPGEFLMGSTAEQVEVGRKMGEDQKIKPDDYYFKNLPSELPQHRVRLTKPFRLSHEEVTIGQFKKFVAESKYQTQAELFGFGNSNLEKPDDTVKPEQLKMTWQAPGYAVADDSPVTQISWNDAVAFCNWLSKQEKLTPCYRQDANSWVLVGHGTGYRLPTEAEWEFACRAGSTNQYWFGDDVNELSKHGWTNKNAGGRAHGVGLLAANPFGMHDMHGNVWEWCHDGFDSKWYERSQVDDPVGPSGATSRVFRGGSWRYTPAHSRSAYRHDGTPAYRDNGRGFRPAL